MIGTDGARLKGSRESLKREFRDEDYRYAYVEDFLNTSIATQIVVLREQRELSQAAFGRLIGTKQPGVSRLEDVNHSTWKTETLKRIARALGVRLRITFETFGSLLDEDEHFGREGLQRPSFSDDPAFHEGKSVYRGTLDSFTTQVGQVSTLGTYHGNEAYPSVVRRFPHVASVDSGSPFLVKTSNTSSGCTLRRVANG